MCGAGLPDVEGRWAAVDRTPPVPQATLSGMEGTFSVAQTTLSVLDKTPPASDNTLSAPDKTFSRPQKVVSVAEGTLSLVDETFSIADKAISMTDKTFAVTDKTLSVTDKVLSAGQKATVSWGDGHFPGKKTIAPAKSPFSRSDSSPTHHHPCHRHQPLGTAMISKATPCASIRLA